MTFADSLKQYMSEIPCTASELSAVSGLAPSMISRYLRSEQSPGDKALRKLAAGLDFLSRDKNGPALNHDAIYQVLQEALSGLTVNYDRFVQNLQRLLSELNINNNELARSLNFDPSYISRILAGTRRPANLHQFLRNVADYISRRFLDSPYLPVIAGITECDIEEIRTREMLSYVIRRFLGSHSEPSADIMSRFLSKIDSFDLEAYRNSIGYDQIPLPTSPYRLPSTGTYHGQVGTKEAELDFMRTVVTSHAADDIIQYSDFSIEEVKKDQDYVTKWLHAMVMYEKKGIHIHHIHDVHQPFNEMLLSLEHWIPMYMSGLVLPYYLKEPTNHTFLHTVRSAGSAGLIGEGIFGDSNELRIQLYRGMEDILYVRRRAQALLDRAYPLMRIYTEAQQGEFLSEREKIYSTGDGYRMIRTVPPIFTMSMDLLNRILSGNGLSVEEAERLRQYYFQTRRTFDRLLETKSMSIELPELRSDESVFLSIPGVFLNKRIHYTKEEYRQHLDEVLQYEQKHPSVTVAFNQRALFKNIEILICRGHDVIVSKNDSRETHFLIHHPKMVQAFESFSPAE